MPNIKLEGLLWGALSLRERGCRRAVFRTFLNGQKMVPIRHILIAMDHPQPDNINPLMPVSKTGVGIVCSFMNPKRSKSLDMRYHWLEDCKKMGRLDPYWGWGIHNWADYFTKIIHQLITRS